MKHRLLNISIIFAFIALISLGGCKKDKKDDLEEFKNSANTTEQQDNVKPVINEDQINEIIGSFPSPAQMAAVLNSLNVPFSKKYLVTPSVTENYDTNNKKAFALGVLTADLGYLNVYERSSLVVEYLSAIKRLSDDLRVSEFFDFQALKRLATSRDNLDSLEILSLQSFRDMDEHLRGSGRSNLSLLMVTGVWLESLYLLTQVEKDTGDKSLYDKIGDQKILFDYLYPVLKIYSDDSFFKLIVDEFKDFQNIFQNVEITYEQGDNKVVYVDGRPVIQQNDKSVIKITDEQVQQLIQVTEKVRNKLINQ